jgi:hypothetical protein
MPKRAESSPSPDHSPGQASSGRAAKRRYVRFTRWRRRRFFALLAESGNVRMACELSGVGLGCIYRLRRTEPGFVALMEAAVAAADRSLSGQKKKNPPPPRCTRSPSPGKPGEDINGLKPGEDLEDECWAVAPPPAADDVVVRRGIGGRLRVMAAGTRWWSARHDAIFLGHLRATGNVARSARLTGFTKKTAYNRRERLPSFARAWEAALDDSEPRLEARVTAEALKGTWGMEEGVYEPGEPESFDFDQALRLLTWRENRRRRRERG